MTCEVSEILISALADGELTGVEKYRVEAHVDSCDECKRLYEDALRLQRSLAGALNHCPDVPDLVSAVNARIMAPRPRLRPAWVWAAAAVIALAVISLNGLHPARVAKIAKQPKQARVCTAPTNVPQPVAVRPGPRSNPANAALRIARRFVKTAEPVRSTPANAAYKADKYTAVVKVEYVDDDSAADQTAGEASSPAVASHAAPAGQRSRRSDPVPRRERPPDPAHVLPRPR